MFVALIVSAALIGLPTPTSGQNKKKDRTLRVDVNLVLVTASVTDPYDRIITGLGPDNFEIYENGERQEIIKFSSEDGPVSVVIILDTSGSMSNKIGPAKLALISFTKSANPQDEFALIYFDNGRAVPATTGFTDADNLRTNLLTMAPHGQTPLLDSIYLALIQMGKAQKENRRAIIIISDGGDNHSRYNERDIKNLVKESETQIYSIGIFDKDNSFGAPIDRLNSGIPLEEIYGPELLNDITNMTGGRAFTIQSVAGLEDTVEKIGNELRNQYLLGYRPNTKDWGKDKKSKKDKTGRGEWRKIKVKVRPPRGLPPLTVRAKSGYYAPIPAN